MTDCSVQTVLICSLQNCQHYTNERQLSGGHRIWWIIVWKCDHLRLCLNVYSNSTLTRRQLSNSHLGSETLSQEAVYDCCQVYRANCPRATMSLNCRALEHTKGQLLNEGIKGRPWSKPLEIDVH
jgi:hypothetical protein